MVEPVTVGVVLVGAFFLFFGAAFSSYGVSALGIVVGGSAGYLLGPTVAASVAASATLVTVGAALGGAVIGLLLSYAIMSLAVAAIAFVVGTYVGLVAVAAVIVEGGMIEQAIVAIIVGVVFALVGLVLTKTMMVIMTAFIGATLGSLSVTAGDLAFVATEMNPDPLFFDPMNPLFIGLFALGVLTQFGLFKFGYVGKVLTLLPGVKPLRNRAERD